MDVFIASTPYHLMLACSMKKNNDILIIENNDFVNDEKIESIINKYFKENVIIVNNYKDMLIKPFQTKVKLKRLIRDLNKKDIQNIFGFNDSEPLVQYVFYKLNSKVNTVILEEGIGLYNKIHYKLPVIRKIFGMVFLGTWFKIINTIGEYKYTKCIYAKNPELLSNIQKRKKVIKYNYKELDNLINNEKIENDAEIWFIGQPLVEDGICKIEDYFDCIKKCQDIVKSKNRKMVIKVHPREDTKKYSKYLKDVEIYDNKNIPFELIINPDSEKNYKLITISSSVMNYSESRNIKVILLCDLIQTDIPFSKLPKKNENIMTIGDWMELDKIMEGDEL